MISEREGVDYDYIHIHKTLRSPRTVSINLWKVAFFKPKGMALKEYKPAG
jgi:hypothetical protein